MTVLSILRRQFDPTFAMLTNAIRNCPESLWVDRRSGNPYWQQVVHVLTGINFWFREAGETFNAVDLGNGPIPDLDQLPTFDVTKAVAMEYLAATEKRAVSFFESLNDDLLMDISSIYDKCTYADLILMQIRHIQHHVGYCNSLLHAYKAPPCKWLGYAE